MPQNFPSRQQIIPALAAANISIVLLLCWTVKLHNLHLSHIRGQHLVKQCNISLDLLTGHAFLFKSRISWAFLPHHFTGGTHSPFMVYIYWMLLKNANTNSVSLAPLRSLEVNLRWDMQGVEWWASGMRGKAHQRSRLLCRPAVHTIEYPYF